MDHGIHHGSLLAWPVTEDLSSRALCVCSKYLQMLSGCRDK